MCRGWAAGGEGRADEACLDAGYETGYLGGGEGEWSLLLNSLNTTHTYVVTAKG